MGESLGSNTITSTLDLIGILTVFWEWLVMLSLAFWIGMLVIKCIVLNGFEQSSILLARSEKWSQPLQWICLLVLLVSQIVTLILQVTLFSQSQNAGPLDPATSGQTVIQSSYGFLWIARIIFILGSLGLLWWATSRQNQLRLSQPFTIVWLILAGLVLLTYPFTDDVAQLNTQLYIYAIVLIWLSLAAQYIWFGGLAYLAYVLIPLLKTIEAGRRNEILTNLLRRFHPLMLITMCVLFVSELYLTRISLSNIQQFRTTSYGRASLVKWVLILMMILFSAYTFFVLRPKLSTSTTLQSVNTGISARDMHRVALNQTTRSVQRLFSIQSWLGVAVLLCAALMTIFVPPIGLPGENSRQNIPSSGTPANTNATQTKQVDNLSVMLAVTPAVTGVSNTVIVTLTDTHSGKPVTNAHIEISPNMELMNMGTVQATMTGGTPAYKATFAQGTTFSMSGIWDIKLIIQLPNQGPLIIVFTILFLSRL
jgi:putative copper export protein